jgi:hypothetical protein
MRPSNFNTVLLWLVLSRRSVSSFSSSGGSVRRFSAIHRDSLGALSRSYDERSPHGRPNNMHFMFQRDLSLAAKPKRGSVVDSYQTVSVNCSKCGLCIFRYKKKNGTKSNLVKCFVERISEDCAGVLRDQHHIHAPATNDDDGSVIEYECPGCKTRFARSATIKGLPALKMVGGKIRMTKK